MYRFIMLFSFAISNITLAACQSDLLVANNKATQTQLTKISEISETNLAAHWLSQTLLVLPKENSYSHHELISEYKDIKKTAGIKIIFISLIINKISMFVCLGEYYF